jgi:preprotein translocase subunit Sss1
MRVPSLARLRERLLNFWRDVRWTVTAARKPDDRELKLAVKFLLVSAFVAGVVQVVFHVIGTYVMSYVYRQPVHSLGDPVKGAVVVLVSVTAIFIALMYLLAKLR